MLPLHTASCNGFAPSASRSLTSAPAATASFTRSRLPDRTASCRSAALNLSANTEASAIRLTHVLHLFFQIHSKPLAHALLQLSNHRAQLCRGTLTRVVDQVGMVVRHPDPAVTESLRTDLFEKPCRRNLSFPHDVPRNLCGNGVR